MANDFYEQMNQILSGNEWLTNVIKDQIKYYDKKFDENKKLQQNVIDIISKGAPAPDMAKKIEQVFKQQKYADILDSATDLNLDSIKLDNSSLNKSQTIPKVQNSNKENDKSR